MATMNVSLPDPMRDWVLDRIDSGTYASVSDYVRDLIRHDQEASRQRHALVDALIEGEQSGVSTLTVPEILAEVLAEQQGWIVVMLSRKPPLPISARSHGTQ